MFELTVTSAVASPSWEEVLPSYSKQDPGMISRLRREGYKIYSPGNGWVYATLPATVKLETADGSTIDVGQFFRDNLGRMTGKRRKLIATTAPKTISIVEDKPSEDDLKAWLERVRKAS